MAVKYVRTMSALRRWGDEIVANTKIQLRVDGFNASGETGKSLRSETKQSGSILSTELKSREIYNGVTQVIQALDQGVKYKGTKPSTSAISKWMKEKNIRPRSANGRFLSPSETNLRRAAFAIAKGIGKLGTIKRFQYRGSSMMERVLLPLFPSITADIETSMGYDIQQEINKGIPNKNLK